VSADVGIVIARTSTTGGDLSAHNAGAVRVTGSLSGPDSAPATLPKVTCNGTARRRASVHLEEERVIFRSDWAHSTACLTSS